MGEVVITGVYFFLFPLLLLTFLLTCPDHTVPRRDVVNGSKDVIP